MHTTVDQFRLWQRWLWVVTVLITLFGIGMALSSATAPFEWGDQQINAVFWPDPQVTGPTADFQHWIYGVLGATMAGWGCCMIFIVSYPFKAREPWAWNCITTGVLLWFLIDTPVSLYFQVYFNVALNTVILVVVFLPLALTRRHFRQFAGRSPTVR
jgi:hypothetical protein